MILIDYFLYKLFQGLTHRPPCPHHVSVKMEAPATLMTTRLSASKKSSQPGIENELESTKTACLCQDCTILHFDNRKSLEMLNLLSKL